MASTPPNPTVQRASKSADAARAAELARYAALTPEERVFLALRLGRRCAKLAKQSVPKTA